MIILLLEVVVRIDWILYEQEGGSRAKGRDSRMSNKGIFMMAINTAIKITEIKGLIVLFEKLEMAFEWNWQIRHVVDSLQE